jgi:outer membrane protein TolC
MTKKQSGLTSPAFLAVFLTIALPAFAGQEMTLDGYIQKTVEASPAAIAILAEIQGMEANALETEQRINPTLQADVTAVRDNSGREVEIEFEQPLRGSDFGARKNYAAAIRAVKNGEQKARLLDLAHDATRAYTALWLAQEKIALLDSLVVDAERQIKVVQKGVSQGIADKGEAQILVTEAGELDLQKQKLESERRILLNAFSHLAGMPVGDYALAAPPVRRLPDNKDALKDMVANEVSIRSLLTSRRAMAERRLAAAKADADLPEVTPRAVVRRDFTGDSSSLLLGVRVQLPLWSRNQAETTRAQAEYTSTDRSLKALEESSFSSVLENAWQSAKDDQNIAEQYRTSIVPGWRDVEKLTEKKLGVGQASIFDLWQVRTKVLESETKSLEAQQDAVEAVLTLENLTGAPFTAVSEKGK